MLKGLDISNHQGLVDWSQIKAWGAQFAFVKASEALDFRDGYFQRNWEHMARVGITRGAYHFARPMISSGAAQAEFFLSEVGQLQAGDLLALDMEAPDVSVDLGAFALDFMQTVEREAGVKPVMYSGQWFMETHGLLTEELAQYGLWYASWQNSMPAAPAPWPVIAFWQSDAATACPGVRGRVDADWFNGDACQLEAYGYREV